MANLKNITDDLSKTREAAVSTIQALMERGEKIQHLEQKSSLLSLESKKLHRSAAITGGSWISVIILYVKETWESLVIKAK